MAGESAPSSLLPTKLSTVTRSGLRRLHVTPSQLQKLVLPLQEARVPEPPLATCSLKASSAAPSPALALGIIRMAMTMSDGSKLKAAIEMRILLKSFARTPK